MDNNFDMPQENYIVSQTPNQPKKKKTGLIVGISIAVVALIAVIVAVVLVFVFVLGGDDLEGTWSYAEQGGEMEIMFDGDGSGTMSAKYEGITILSFDFKYTYDEDTKVLNMELDESSEVEQSSGAYKVTKLTDDELVLETDDETLELKRVD